MRLAYDWAASTPAERALNLVLRPFGLDCFVELHKVGSWQWGLDMPNQEHLTWELWFGPLHIMIERA